MDHGILARLDQTNNYINYFLLTHNQPPIDYCWKDFADHYIEENKIALITDLEGIDIRCYSAFTVKSSYTTAIFINPDIPEGRKNFSICHELSHHLYDFNDAPSQSFFSVAENPSLYKLEEKRMEQLANASAGILMLPDISLIEHLEKKHSFPKMTDLLGMTPAALYIRLVQFLEYQCHVSENYARQLMNQFRYYGKLEGILRCLDGWGSTVKKQIWLNYENCAQTKKPSQRY